MFLLIFTVIVKDVVVPDVATMSARGRCPTDYYPVGNFPAAARDVFRLQDIWGWMQESLLLKIPVYEGVVEFFLL